MEQLAAARSPVRPPHGVRDGAAAHARDGALPRRVARRGRWDGGADLRDPLVQRQLPGDQAVQRGRDRRLDVRAAQRGGEQRDHVQRLDGLADPGRDLGRRHALAEQLARAAVARLRRERRADEVAGARQADHRLRLAALALGVAPHLGEDVARRRSRRVQALDLRGARGERRGVLGDAGELDADGVVGLLAHHAGAHEHVRDRRREPDVGGGGDQPGALGDHLARVRRAPEAPDAVHAAHLVEQRRGREAVRRNEALRHRDHRRARRQAALVQVRR